MLFALLFKFLAEFPAWHTRDTAHFGSDRKRLQPLPSEGAVVTEERITFWILVTPLHPGPRPRLMHDASPHVHSERGLAMRRRLPRKSLTVTACHWVVKGHLPPSWSEAFLPFAWGGTWKDGQCCGMNRALLLCYYSVQVLEPFSPKQWKQKQKPKAESEDNNFFVFCLVRW